MAVLEAEPVAAVEAEWVRLPCLQVKGEVINIFIGVINIFIGVTTLNSSFLIFYSLSFNKTMKTSFTPRHCLSKDLVFPLHH